MNLLTRVPHNLNLYKWAWKKHLFSLNLEYRKQRTLNIQRAELITTPLTLMIYNWYFFKTGK